MSQNEESKSQKSQKGDKWREIAEETDAESTPDSVGVDEELSVDESSIKALADKNNLLQKQLEFLKDQVARSQAELANVQRRMDQEVSKARKFGVEKLVSELIPVTDSLLRGLDVSTTDDSAGHVRQGVELTLDMLSKLLEKNGVTLIEPEVGTPFDPMQQEAMSMRQDPKATPNTVLQVLQKGYALHGRVIRAAMVIVAA